jgi:hypothetical protein
MNWLALFQNIGLFMVASGALSWLAKILVSQSLSRDLAKFKVRLKAAHDKEIEQLKTDLKTAAFEHQTRFASLHEKRGRVIARLYSRLVAAEKDIGKLLEVEASQNEEYKRMFIDAGKKAAILSTFFDDQRIYFDEELCKRMDALNSNLTQAWLYGSPAAPAFFGDEATIKAQLKKLKDEIPAVRREIEERIREILGVRRP